MIYNPTGVERLPPQLEDGWPAGMPTGFSRWGPRTPLWVSFSADDGETWPWKVVLEEGPGEYSYPTAVQSKDGTLHITHTYNRVAIRHAAVPEGAIEELCRA